MGAGRPSKYESIKPKFKFIKSLIKDGWADKDIAEMLGLANDTLYRYKRKYPEFSECFDKKDNIAEVEQTYFNRLTGRYKATREVYKPDENGELKLVEVQKYEIPLNDGAYKHYLATLCPERWRDNNTNNSDSDLSKITDAIRNVVSERVKEDNKKDK